MEKVKKGPYALIFKRLIDVICSLSVIILFSWMYLIIMILVRIKLGKPVFFKQSRPGKIDPKTGKEKIFCLYKFRTMTNARDDNGELLSDSDRLTSFGAWLRRTSIDEIPEFFNILKGDMSLIGPRPLLIRYLPYYTKRERLRHSVRPGLTGLAQISGRNTLVWNDRLFLDVKYAENITFLNDAKILFKTISKVIKRENIIDAGNYGMMDLDQERRNFSEIN